MPIELWQGLLIPFAGDDAGCGMCLIYKEAKISMKRLIKGGFLTLSGVIGVIGTMMVAMQNPSSAWETPPGRMVTSILENEMLIPAILFLLLLVSGLYILLTENKAD